VADGLQIEDTAGGITPLKGTRGGAHVVDTTLALGNEYTFNAAAPLRTGGGNPATLATYAIKNATGFTFFEIAVPKLTTDDYLVVAWSTIVDDETALAAILDAYCDEIEGVVSIPLKVGSQSTNVDKCTLAGEAMAHMYDGTTTIKTILAVIVRLANTTPSATAPVFYGCRVMQL